MPTGVVGWKISVYSSFALKHRLKKKNIQIVAGHSLLSFENGLAILGDLSLAGEARSLQVDSVIAPVAGVPHAPPETVADTSIFNVGDSVSARTALEAVFEGHETALFLDQ